METAAVAVIRLLVFLDRPVSFLGAVIGLITAIRTIPRADAAAISELGILERIAVGLCGGVAFLGFLGIVQTLIPPRPGFSPRSGFSPLSAVFAGAVLLASLPALLWRSRWRGVAEGVATVCVAVMAFLSGFTIGFMFVPLAALMIWICFMRLFRPFADARERTVSRVDSLP